jgi:phosphatidate cytidylyltransferase
MVQLSDVFQYLWSQIPMKHPIAPKINLTRTWEGLFGGAATTTLCGMALWFATPFPHWWQAGMIALAISLMGFAGSMTMSAIKRDRGVEDYGTLVEGHSGVLDRMDSVCFAAPVFYHLCWLFMNLYR